MTRRPALPARTPQPGAATRRANIVADNNPTCAKTGGNCLNGTGTSTTNPAGTAANGNCYGYNVPPTRRRWANAGRLFRRRNWQLPRGPWSIRLVSGQRRRVAHRTNRIPYPPVQQTAQRRGPAGSYSGTPCNAIGAMASNKNTFYSDNSGGCPALTIANQDFTSLVNIFDAITTGLTSPRLIPNGTP